MCLAIYKPLGENVPEDYLENGFDSNSDGAGFAYRNGENIVVRKGFFNFNNFIEEWRRVSSKQALIHFRWATSGKRDVDNCHPFLFNKNKHVMIHNGVLSHRTEPTLSDTVCFVQDVLEPVSKRYGFNVKTKAVLESHIGQGNKMVIMSRNGKVHILNEEAGHWKDRVWYSNSSYEDSYYKWTKSYSFKHDNDIRYLPYIKETGYEEEYITKKNWWDSTEYGMIPCDFCNDVFSRQDMCPQDKFTICHGCYNIYSTAT